MAVYPGARELGTTGFPATTLRVTFEFRTARRAGRLPDAENTVLGEMPLGHTNCPARLRGSLFPVSLLAIKSALDAPGRIPSPRYSMERLLPSNTGSSGEHDSAAITK